jgi:hypothetical protein
MTLSSIRDPRRVLLVLLGSIFVITTPSLVRAHELPPDRGGDPVTLGLVITVSVLIAVIGGVAVVRTGTSLRPEMHEMFGKSIGALLIVLGLIFALSAVREYLSLAIAGILCGGLVARSISSRTGRAYHAEITFGTMVAHRSIEGLALAALYLSGSTLQLISAFLVAGHVAVETIVVGGLYSDQRWSWAILAIALLQAGFVFGVAVGLLMTVVVPGHLAVVLQSGGAGALLIIGNAEIAAHRRPMVTTQNG